MPPPEPLSISDRREGLEAARAAEEAQLLALDSDLVLLGLRIRQAREQLRYYERLLHQFRREWTRPLTAPQVLRNLD